MQQHSVCCSSANELADAAVFYALLAVVYRREEPSAAENIAPSRSHSIVELA